MWQQHKKEEEEAEEEEIKINLTIYCEFILLLFFPASGYTLQRIGGNGWAVNLSLSSLSISLFF